MIDVIDVVAVGDLNLDIITSPIKALPGKETSCDVEHMGLYTGGNAANFAAAAACLKLKTRFMGALGPDPISRWLMEKMREYGVECVVKVREDSSAGITFAITYTDGTRQFIAAYGSNNDLSIEDIDFSKLKGVRHVHRSGFWYCKKIMGEPTKRLLRYTRELGAETSLDIGWDDLGWTDERVSMVYKCLQYVTVFFINEKELQHLYRKNDIKAAASEALEMGVKVLALHLGEKGSMVFTKDTIIKAPAYRVKPLNPTGSGDAYNAAFVYGMLKRRPLNAVADFANAAAALHIIRTKPVFPEIKKVETFMAETEKRL